jgi:probable F420-dependent oxidoreductase
VSPEPRPFRFGVGASQAAGLKQWRQLCRQVEDLGYSSLLVSDHFGDQLALVPALTAAAQATEHLRVGTLVACNDYRHPVTFAKELATIDLFSSGRVEWGMGAGWLAPEYAQAGIPFASGGVRLARLQEAVALMQGLFADGVSTFHGAHYTVEALDGRPTPVQRPHPPLLVGGAGRRLLSWAARTADIVGVGPSLDAHPAIGGPDRPTAAEATDRQIGWIRAAAGDRLGALELNLTVLPVRVTDDRPGVAAAAAGELGIPVEELLDSPHALIGTVDEICDDLEARRARWGISYWVVPSQVREAFAPVVERLSGR